MESPRVALGISRAMWQKLLCDPVLAAYAIFGVKLDAFQACRLRYYWWCQNVVDSSGVSSGKTISIWLFLNLRAILIPDQEMAIYYPVFDQGKNSFWNYYTEFKRAPIFTSQLGNSLKLEAGEEVSGDGTVHGANSYKAIFRNGNKLLMPATNMAKDMITQGSVRLNVMVVEEWPDVDAQSDGINKQLIGRTSRGSWNQFHPLWGNHILLSGHAQTRMHPSSVRMRSHQRKAAAGDPNWVNISYCFKNYSDRVSHTGKTFRQQWRVEGTIANDKETSSKGDWLGKGLGIWGANGEGWFSEEALLRCQAAGRARGLTPCTSRAQFFEAHPALVE
ncbi:MAG: hypothetical protein KGL39_60250 [Patescibacteria group bacterium]|nr:hypothetical protein [Patescibacteria group bacterium]